MSDVPDTNGDFHKLAELIKDVRVAMMHTFTSSSGPCTPDAIHVRPMYTQRLDPETFNGELFFFTDAESAKVTELLTNPHIMLTYAAAGSDQYVVVKGTAVCEHNPALAEELWNIHAKGWWPEGPQSRHLSVMRVRVGSAEYWEGPSKMTYAARLIKAVATGERIETHGEHGKV